MSTAPPATDAQPLRVGTHSGSFHADDVFALAALKLLHGELDIVRTRDAELLAGCDLRVDVGRKYDPATGDFDHHQGDAGERSNGIRFASFGLIWKAIGRELCGSAYVADEIDDELVAPIDAGDNGHELTESLFPGIVPFHLGRVIGGFGPVWDDPDREGTEQRGFEEAFELALGVLKREIAAAQARARAADLVRDAIRRAEDPRIIEFTQGMPWKDVVLAESADALVVIYPRVNDWGVQTVPAERQGFANRRDLPKEWAGLEGPALQSATGVPDAVFCHVSRFMAVAGSREGALALARLAVA